MILFGIPALTWVKVLVSVFTAILMLQSGLDKVFNYAGNKAWLTDFFKNSPLRNTVGLLLPTITLLEVAAGAVSAVGAVCLLVCCEEVAFYGMLLAAISFVCLFFGQRLAQDYAGAGNMTVYFIMSILGLSLYCMN
jgi:hypothetical protein